MSLFPKQLFGRGLRVHRHSGQASPYQQYYCKSYVFMIV